MAPRCKACDHPDRAALDTALAEGASSFRTIADRFGLSETGLKRHKAEHLPAHLARATAAAAVAQADTILSRLAVLNVETRAVLAAAKRAENHPLALQAIARAEKQLELEAKLVGELREGPTVNVILTPAWTQAVAVLLAALAPYPEARVRAADALARLEAGGVDAR